MYGSPTWGVYVALAALLFLYYVQAGLDRQKVIRCTACGARAGERHHRDCHYKER